MEEKNKTSHKEDQNISELEELKKKLESCERMRDEYLEGWKRTKADFINYKKGESERLESMGKFSNEMMIRDLIHILDSFDLGLTVLKEEDAGRKGMELIRSQYEDALRRYGLETIPAKAGDQFDPAKHEAVMEIESSYPPGAVAECIEKGYTLFGKVIRPTRVKLSKGQ